MSTFLGGVVPDWRPDEISQAVGDPRYATNWSWKDLTLACLGPYQKGRITVSRFYLLRKPRVIIDFEPAPDAAQKMWCEEKRRWLQGIGFVYVPIFLRESLTIEQLQARIQLETEAAEMARTEWREKTALKYVPVGKKTARPEFSDPQVREYIEREVLERIAAEESVGKKYLGKHKRERIHHHRKLVEEEVRRRIDDGRLGREFSYHEREVAD